MVVCLERGAGLHMAQRIHCHSLSLAPVKSRLVLPFRYRLTRIVPDRGPLNGCVCVLLLTSHTSSRPTDAERRHNLNGSCDMPTKHTKVVFTWGHLTVRSHGLADINVKKTYCLRPLDIKK